MRKKVKKKWSERDIKIWNESKKKLKERESERERIFPKTLLEGGRKNTIKFRLKT